MRSRPWNAPPPPTSRRPGFWFLQSHTWQHHVLRVAINDLRGLFSEPLPEAPVLLDAGCGQGKSFRLLADAFAPARMIGLDADPHSLDCSRAEAERLGLEVQLVSSDCAAIALPDASVDLLFCHQTFHHLVEQERALAEFWRVLKPGGYLLFAESTRYYIDTCDPLAVPPSDARAAHRRAVPGDAAARASSSKRAMVLPLPVVEPLRRLRPAGALGAAQPAAARPAQRDPGQRRGAQAAGE